MSLSKKLLFGTKLCFLFVFITFSSFGQTALQTQMDQFAKKVKGNLGFCAIVLETGATASYNGDKQFPMQSVYKFPIAMAVLDKVDKGELGIEQSVRVDRSEFIPEAGHSPIREKFPDGVDITVRDLIRYNVAESDGTACDVLLRLLGGTENADRYIHKLGVNDIAISTTEMVQVADDSIQYRNWATPKSMTKLLQIFYTANVLSDKSKTLLLNDMIESTPGAKRLKGLLPSGTIVAHKTGTAGTFNGLTRATNDAGIITLPNGNHLAITVFISDSYDSHSERELVIAQVAKAAFDFWATGK